MKEKKDKKKEKDKQPKKRGKGFKALLILPLAAILLFIGFRAVQAAGYGNQFVPVQLVQNFFGQGDSQQGALQSGRGQVQGQQNAQAFSKQQVPASGDQQQGTQAPGQQDVQAFGNQQGTPAFGGQQDRQAQAGIQNGQVPSGKQGRGDERGFGKEGRGDKHGQFQQGQGMKNDGFARGGHGGRGHNGGFMGYLFAAGALIFGWLLHKTAGESTWQKWAGLGLAAAGLAFVLPLPVVILAAAIAAFYMKRNASRTDEEWVEAPLLQDMQVESSNAAKLDEWERNVSKEDK